jgi:hypothetical protein
MPDLLQRRNNPRSSFRCFARFRALEAGTDNFERLCVTQDFSHDGLYFLALDESVGLKMRLLLRFPYLRDPDVSNRECLVEVVRTKSLYPGRCGVGVKLIDFRSPAKRSDSIYLEACPPKELTLDGIDLYA